MSFTASNKVVDVLKGILKEANKEGSFVRLGILDEGGCKFNYRFNFDKSIGDNDTIVEQHGLKFVFDKLFSEKMDKTEIDFSEEENRVGVILNYKSDDE